MVTEDEDSEIKLVDFGLSKTFGPGETCKEPYGTLCYVAPEILTMAQTGGYDAQVDVWSMGGVYTEFRPAPIAARLLRFALALDSPGR